MMNEGIVLDELLADLCRREARLEAEPRFHRLHGRLSGRNLDGPQGAVLSISADRSVSSGGLNPRNDL